MHPVVTLIIISWSLDAANLIWSLTKKTSCILTNKRLVLEEKYLVWMDHKSSLISVISDSVTKW